MKPMDFEKIRARLDKLVAEGRKGELRGALSMLNEVDIAEYMEELDNEKMLMVFRLLPKDIGCTLPLLAKAVHLDPALMASPLITTIVDICSLLVLFSVATEVLHV